MAPPDGTPGRRRRSSVRTWLLGALIGLILLVPMAAGSLFVLPAKVSGPITARLLGEPVITATADPAATSSVDPDTRIDIIERDVADIKDQQDVLLAITIDQLRYLLGGLSVLLTVIVAIQAFLQSRQDKVQHGGLEQVTQVMGVIEKTLQSNLLTSEEVRKQAVELRAEMDSTFDAIISAAREAVERSAETLASRPRHEHRLVMAELTTYARDFDNFGIQYGAMAKWVDKLKLTARALYVRGVAGHYANDPAAARRYLLAAISDDTPSSEPEESRRKRKSIAYYYLGLTSSNFGDPAKAVDYLQEAANLDTSRTDFLTMIAAAEALAIAGDPRAVTEAQGIVDEVDRKRGPLDIMKPEFRRHRSRALMVQANASVMSGGPGYRDRVRRLLEPTRAYDRDYYYATITLAQVSDDADAARQLYLEAVDDIRNSDDLGRITEVRSQILLRMAYALALMHGPADRHAEHQLGRAIQLCASLPREGANVCTVFSILSKDNVSQNVVLEHIEAIRRGTTILPG